MIKLIDILNEGDINWGTLDNIIKTAKYDPATGKKILQWAATHPPHSPYLREPSTRKWKKELKYCDWLAKDARMSDGSKFDMRNGVKKLDASFWGGKKEAKIILAYWFSTNRWRK
jgi:hypothetical protein